MTAVVEEAQRKVVAKDERITKEQSHSQIPKRRSDRASGGKKKGEEGKKGDRESASEKK